LQSISLYFTEYHRVRQGSAARGESGVSGAGSERHPGHLDEKPEAGVAYLSILACLILGNHPPVYFSECLCSMEKHMGQQA
jgi:hypothetical protein